MTIFLPKVGEPIQTGWYYGRRKRGANHEIQPVLVRLWRGQLKVVNSSHFGALIGSFDWFGPVPELQEASKL